MEDSRYAFNLSLNAGSDPGTNLSNSLMTNSFTGPLRSAVIIWNTWGFRSVRTDRWMNEKSVCSITILQSTERPADSSDFPMTHAMAALCACLSNSVRSTGLIWSFQRFILAELNSRYRMSEFSALIFWIPR